MCENLSPNIFGSYGIILHKKSKKKKKKKKKKMPAHPTYFFLTYLLSKTHLFFYLALW